MIETKIVALDVLFTVVSTVSRYSQPFSSYKGLNVRNEAKFAKKKSIKKFFLTVNFSYKELFD